MAGPESTDKPKAPAATKSVAVADATTYVGTPAVGTSKAAPAAGVASIGPDKSQLNEGRRRLVWCGVGGFFLRGFIAFFRVFLAPALFGPLPGFKMCHP